MTTVTVSHFDAVTLEVYKHHNSPDNCATLKVENVSIQIRTFEELQKLEDALSEVRAYLASFSTLPPNDEQRILPLVIQVGT